MMEIQAVFRKLGQLLGAENVELAQLTNLLESITVSVRTEKVRKSLESVHWNTLSRLSTVASQQCLKDAATPEDLDFICELLRSLRNSCAGNFQSQQHILSTEDILPNTAEIYMHFAMHHNVNSTERETNVLSCCLQFFGNALYRNDTIKEFVWTTMYEIEILRRLFQSSSSKVRQHSMMVLYSCFTVKRVDEILHTEKGQKMLSMLIESLRENLVDWGLFLMETFVISEQFMSKGYDSLSLDDRLFVLDLIAEALEKPALSKICLPASLISHIARVFKAEVLDIVRVCATEDQDLKPLEVSRLLSVLCEASANEDHCGIVKCYPELLDTALDILRTVHFLGKKDNNAFSLLGTIKEVSAVEKDEMEQSPTYGFKKDLVRLIGNMCSDCKENQDRVRSLEGIPLILDCCRLDARNPYIMQWCIFAIRNLMEKNRENQEVLAQITVTSDLVESPLLRELGFDVYMKDGKPAVSSYMK